MAEAVDVSVLDMSCVTIWRTTFIIGCNRSRSATRSMSALSVAPTSQIAARARPQESASARKDLGGGVVRTKPRNRLCQLVWSFVGFKRACNTPRHWNLRQKTERNSSCNSEGLPVSGHLDFYRGPDTSMSSTGDQGELVWDTLAQKVGWTTAVGELTEQHFSQWDDLFARQLKHFFDCIENHTPPRISLQDGVEVMKIMKR